MQTIAQPVSRPSVVTIRQVWGMSQWQLPTFIICVGFQRRDIVYLSMLYLEVYWVIVKTLIFSNTINNFCRNKLLGLGHDLVATAYFYHMCRFLKAWCFGIGNVKSLATGYLDHLFWVSKECLFGPLSSVFGGWLGDCPLLICRFGDVRLEVTNEGFENHVSFWRCDVWGSILEG